MRNKNLDLSVTEVGSQELPIGAGASIDLSVTELENVSAPDLSSFLQSVSTSAAISGLILAT
ncbi:MULTISPECIES: hypothetical protein [Amycolatopsis]|uniref:Uncharacterized protein n=1 Tax=Amycolatopsis echigonensis TaxID=2576905 RepID=A0A8E2B8F5_9PSEU|nr:hypothetical protein [Amycolatopsis echigonensis]MBB2505784.1 hypothetical protein [Amycolatopsis echigonensis]